MNLPNKISIARILLIPIFIFFLLSPIEMGTVWQMKTNVFIALIIFIFASLTDWIDGFLARKMNLVTNFGKFIDPLADKLLMTGGFIALIEMGLAPAWMIILILAREFAVTGIRVIGASEGVVISAAKSGKIKTTVQMLTIILLLININGGINLLMLWSSTVITLYSGIEYFVKNKTLLLDKG